MYDKKNSVLFTETECLVLSPDFKILDESQVLLRIPRQNNMYSFDLKNVVPAEDLTCLFVKATLNESKLWHTRMGHGNFKIMNKLVKGNLVRGLPSKIFENDHTCVACQTGKQHKASCKTKLVSSISQPLQLLHMDLFSPTSVRSINQKTYCLVVTDDFSRCDNGTEFKNMEMNEFYRVKGIKKEFSVARTPQQNGVAERKNRTPIEAARTMLADTLLPTHFRLKPPSISFMRPFGCPVTILNTLGPLGKFDGKADEGFLVGYSVNSKAFKVFNSKTRKVEKNLHVKFLENKPNVAGQGPNWLFDIDSLTNSMNYQPVTIGNQTDKNACPQETNGDTSLKKNVDAGQTGEENVSNQQYIMLPLWSSISSNYKSLDEKNGNDTADDTAGKKTIEEPASEDEQAIRDALDKMLNQEKEATEQSNAFRKEFEAECDRELLHRKAPRASSINSVNTVSTPVHAANAFRGVNAASASGIFSAAGPSFVPLNVTNFPDDPLMPNLEDTSEVQSTAIFGNAYDDDDLDDYNTPYSDHVVGAEADFNNMEPSTILELKKVTQALDDESWVEAMKEELLQFKLLNVWTLVDLPYGKRTIGTKQEEGIDYDEVFAPIARIEAIMLFLAYASFMDFTMYQMEVKKFLDRVYRVEKALFGLHQAPRAWYETLSTYLLENGFKRGTIDKTLFIKKIKNDILLVQVYLDDIIFCSSKKSLSTELSKKKDGIFISQDKYVCDILKKFGFSSVKTVSTLMETHKPLSKDADGTDVDVHLYRSMIGSLMYLTSSRSDIMFAVCTCSRFQVQPKASHMHAVKRIFRYLKGQPTLGLWYPKDSPLDLIAYSDSNYAGASLDRKSTTGGCQFLGCRLISWQCKKQIVVANSTTEAEYIAASNCCGLVLWLQNQLLGYGYNFMQTKIYVDNESAICIVKNHVFHSKTKHIEISNHFIRDSYEKILIEIVKIHTDYNVADLLTKAFDVNRFKFLVASIVETIAAQRKFRAAQRAAEIRSKPPTKTQLRNMMIPYLKNMGKFNHNQLKAKSYEELQRLYEREQKWIHDFVPMDSEKEEKKSVDPEKQESIESHEEAAADYKQEKEELRMWLTVVPDEEETVDLEILSARAYGNTSYHKSLSSMLRKFDRQDLVGLHRLMMKSFKDNTPEARTTANPDGTSTSTIPGPVTTKGKAQKKNDVKARSMLLMVLPNEHLLTFSQYKDAKTLFAAIHARFSGNDATKKTQKTLLKQMYENFNAPST
ncbi:putative ribonuclease H-like domain-containing protein [Tanacetum coccineum]